MTTGHLSKLFKITIPSYQGLTPEERAIADGGGFPLRLETFHESPEALSRAVRALHPTAADKAGARIASALGDVFKAAIREELHQAVPPAPVEPQEDGYLDVRSAAKLLGCTPRSVRNYITRGLLRAHHVGSPGRMRLLLSRGRGGLR